MQGLFFYGDFCSGRIWGLRQVTGVWQATELLDTTIGISTFGEDEQGNLYVANYNNGTIFSVTDNARPNAPTPTPTPNSNADHFNRAVQRHAVSSNGGLHRRRYRCDPNRGYWMQFKQSDT